MARFVKDGDADGRPGGGNGKNKEAWGKGAIEGSSGGDHLQGLHDEPDTIYGLDGDDNINGFSGDDFLVGGNGADDITTGQGEDTVDLRGVTDDGTTPDDPTDDTYGGGDGENDTVNIGVDDDQPDGDVDLFDTILGYEVAVPGTEEGTFETKDVVELDGIGDSINGLVEGGTTGDGEAGTIVDHITASELGDFLWVTTDGALVFDADGSGPGDEDILAELTLPDDSVAVDGVTVRFSAEVEVVLTSDMGTIETTTVQDAEYVAVWGNDGWSISVDGDWMVV